MNYKTFYLDTITVPDNVPDVARTCDFDGLEYELRIIQTTRVFGIVIGGYYLSLAGGGNCFKRGDFLLLRDDDNRLRVGINSELFV